jgi:hypothetical protein
MRSAIGFRWRRTFRLAGGAERDAYLPAMDRVSKWITAAYAAAAVALAALLPLNLLARLFPDDAFFYLSIARNFAAGKGSSFDGLHPTNGYHPLWMLLLSLFHHLLPLRGEPGLRGVIVLDAALFVVALLAMGTLLARVGLSAPAQRCATAVAVATVGFANFGMEAFVWLAAFWSFTAVVWRLLDRPSGAGTYLLAALSVVACYLARSDSALFIAAMGGYLTVVLVAREGERGAGMALAAIWAPLIWIAVAQAAVNRAYFGSAHTISSALKLGPASLGLEMLRADDGRTLQTTLHRGVFLGVVGASALAIALLVASAWRDAARNHWRRLLVAANAYVFLFCTAALLTLTEAPRTWYYTVAFSVLTVTALSIVEWWPRRVAAPRKGPLYVGAALVGLLAFGSLAAQVRSSPHDNSLATAAWLRSHTTPDTISYVTDGSGIISYFSERPVIDGDGLANTFHFKDCVERRQLDDYLRENDVAIVIANVNGSDVAPWVALSTPSWWHRRGYVYARAPSDKALARFTVGGHFGFVPFRAGDLELVRPGGVTVGAM